MTKKSLKFDEETIIDDNYELDEATAMVIAASDFLQSWIKSTVLKRDRSHLKEIINKLNDVSLMLDFYNPETDLTEIDNDKSQFYIDNELKDIDNDFKLIDVNENKMSDRSCQLKSEAEDDDMKSYFP